MADKELMAIVKDLGNWEDDGREGNTRRLRMYYKGSMFFQEQVLKGCIWKTTKYWTFTPSAQVIKLRSKNDVVERMRLIDKEYRK